MKEELILGIDEAGMGPVFGPMVVSGVVIRKKDTLLLREIGVKDSKMFGTGASARSKREKVWEAAKPYIISENQIVIEACQLDKYNMHGLHIEATRNILKKLGWNKTCEVYIEQIGGMKRDTCFSRIGFWHSGFIYEPKADVKYAAVSLASIKAKILRDEIISKLCNDLNEEYVSGYPNYKTEAFFRRYYNKYGTLPPGTRVSRKWQPIEEMKEIIVCRK